MKKAFAILALVAAMFVAGNAQAQISINAGYSPEKFVAKQGNYSESINYQGFFVGITDNFVLYKGLGVAPGLQFRMNTKSQSETYLGTTVKTTSQQMLIDVPILFNYGIAINDKIAITPFAGPMFSLAILGKDTSNAGNSSITENWYENGNVNRFNVNLVGGAAVSFNKAKLFAGYRFGLVDMDKNNESLTIKTQGFFVGLGYTF